MSHNPLAFKAPTDLDRTSTTEPVDFLQLDLRAEHLARYECVRAQKLEASRQAFLNQ